MHLKRNGKFLFVMTLGLSVQAWGQGGGRAGRAAAAAQQSGAPAAQGRGAATPGGAPAGGAGAGSAGDFFAYDASAGASMPIPDGPPTESHQKITADSGPLAYTARVGYLPLRSATTGQTEAHVFYSCYMKDGGSESSSRPLVFFLGGAPGVAATWQEFGGLGPKKMKWAADGTAGTAPYGWVDNPHTLLTSADLVFVNPVGTAFSRPDQPNKGPSFWNTAGDIASLAEFVRVFVTANNLRNAPLFLAGEDFGTGRVAGLATYLIEHQVPVQGVMLLSMTANADAGAGDTQYITMLPSLIMTAWYHKKLTADLNGMSAEQISGQARQFASREYLHALYKGDRMSADEKGKVLADLSKMTGLSKQFLINNDLRVTLDRFGSELMREQHRGLANSDSRVSGYVPSAGGGRGGGGGGGRGGFGVPAMAIDFNLSGLAGGFQAAYEAYLRHELAFTANANGVFYLSNGGVTAFTATGSDDASLAGAFARNPHMRLFVGVNYFDLSAPFYATEYALAHLSVSPEVRSHNITVSHFESGQMAYVDAKASVKLEADLARFVTEATARK